MNRPHDRFEFSALPQRKRWKLPGDARIAVYTVVNVEEWNVEKPLAREYVTSPAGVVTVPNIPNWSWHEYGMRVGIWRIMDALAKRNLKASAAINGRVCEGEGEPVARAMHESGWPFMGHGYEQIPVHALDDQRESFRKSFQILKEYTGTAPKGWLGPGLQETFESLDYLAETGFRFVCDWPMDEQPVEMKTTSHPIVAMPYNLELSDLPMMIIHHHESPVWLNRVVDQFDRLYADGADNPRVMSMSVHPYITGAPHRIKYFEAAYDHILQHDEVWFATAEEIYDWFQTSKDSGE